MNYHSKFTNAYFRLTKSYYPKNSINQTSVISYGMLQNVTYKFKRQNAVFSLVPGRTRACVFFLLALKITVKISTPTLSSHGKQPWGPQVSLR